MEKLAKLEITEMFPFSTPIPVPVAVQEPKPAVDPIPVPTTSKKPAVDPKPLPTTAKKAKKPSADPNPVPTTAMKAKKPAKLCSQVKTIESILQNLSATKKEWDSQILSKGIPEKEKVKLRKSAKQLESQIAALQKVYFQLTKM